MYFYIFFKPGFHLSGKSQTIGDSLFPDVPDFAEILGNLTYSLVTEPIFICRGKWGTAAKQFRGLVTS